eukprot:g58551.t1
MSCYKSLQDWLKRSVLSPTSEATPLVMDLNHHKAATQHDYSEEHATTLELTHKAEALRLLSFHSSASEQIRTFIIYASVSAQNQSSSAWSLDCDHQPILYHLGSDRHSIRDAKNLNFHCYQGNLTLKFSPKIERVN